MMIDGQVSQETETIRENEMGNAAESYPMVTYDVLGNERHKAACRLGTLRPESDKTPYHCLMCIATAIGASGVGGTAGFYENVFDRLIYLLDGEGKTINLTLKTGQVVPVEDYDAVIDLLRDAAMEYGEKCALADSLWLDLNQERCEYDELLADYEKLKRRYKKLKRKLRRERELSDALGEDCDTLLDVLRERQTVSYPYITTTPATVPMPDLPTGWEWTGTEISMKHE